MVGTVFRQSGMNFKNVTLRRGVKGASTAATINPGEQVGLAGRNGAANPRCLRCSTARCRRRRRFLHAAAVAHGAGGPEYARDRRTGHGFCAGWRYTLSSLRNKVESRAYRRWYGHRPGACRTCRMRAARRAATRAGADPGLGFQVAERRSPREQLLRRLAHAPAAGRAR